LEKFILPALIRQAYPTPGQYPRHSALLVALVLLHAVVGAVIGLSVDEAHYLLYAYHPALSYFDHPPLVGWVQWPLVSVDAPLVFLRLVPGCLWLGAALGVYRLANYLQGKSHFAYAGDAGRWSLVALALAPLLHVLGIGLVPDTLLMFFSAALLALTLRMVTHSGQPTRGRWLVLGTLLGLAGLAKYTAIFSAVAVVLCLLVARGLVWLRSPWPWVALVLALLIVSPVAVWNAQNGWISFTYQASHGAGNAWSLSNLLRFLSVRRLF
jgi:4-amino-4-deoxy-L-arabinose transferase-like glycosyltransferase